MDLDVIVDRSCNQLPAFEEMSKIVAKAPSKLLPGPGFNVVGKTAIAAAC